MAHMQHFTNLKLEMEEKRKSLTSSGSGGWGPRGDDAREYGGGAREHGGGGGGPRKNPFIYFTKGVPSNWGPTGSTDGGGAVLF